MNLNKAEVLRVIIELSLNWESEGVVNVGWIAGSMDSTPYYVRKRIKTLIEEGYLEHSIRSGGWCEYSCEPYPPIKGYSITQKTMNTKMYTESKKNFENKLTEAYGC